MKKYIYDIYARPHEECGIFGIYSKNKDFNVAEIIFYGLQALQHRGQESAGIAVSDEERILIYKDLGLVSSVFNEQNLAPLQGHLELDILDTLLKEKIYGRIVNLSLGLLETKALQ